MNILAKFFMFMYKLFSPKEVAGEEQEYGFCEVKTTLLDGGQIRLEIDHDDEFIEYLRREGGFQGNDDEVLHNYLQTLLRSVIDENHSNPSRFE